MKYLPLLLLLAGCQGEMQSSVTNSEYVCKDGVEYFVYERMDTGGRLASNVVPHFHLDGTLYPCTEHKS